jgi:hypothetical protein
LEELNRGYVIPFDCSGANRRYGYPFTIPAKEKFGFASVNSDKAFYL